MCHRIHRKKRIEVIERQSLLLYNLVQCEVKQSEMRLLGQLAHFLVFKAVFGVLEVPFNEEDFVAVIDSRCRCSRNDGLKIVANVASEAIVREKVAHFQSKKLQGHLIKSSGAQLLRIFEE